MRFAQCGDRRDRPRGAKSAPWDSLVCHRIVRTSKLRIVLLSLGLCAALGAQQKIGLVATGAPSTPSGNALRLLEETLQRRGVPLRRLGTAQDRRDDELLLILSLSASLASLEQSAES